ncbi:MAG: serine/threonine-protein kinase [Kofleriaceae bacterium]
MTTESEPQASEGAVVPGALAPARVQPSACPDENALAELVQGLLDDDVASQLELHLDTCEQCRRIVSSVGQSSYLAARRTRVDSGRALGSGASDVAPSTWSMPQNPAAIDIPAVGTILAGKYRVEGLLGQGGMGVVMAAKHLTLGKLVALKVMRPDLAVDKVASQRFVREARAASLLRSEHIARVIDLDTLDDGAPYIAMEYLEGEDLGAVLTRRGTIAAHEAAIYIVQVCEAIAEAHAAGIVHRDLKPANLFLTHRGNMPCVKVLDFGVSKIIAGGPLLDDVASTDTKSLVGSPHYMAPEQLISAKAVDPRTDIWALGCILFELVSGKSPFNTGAALAQVMASILRDNAPSLRVTCPHLPDGFVTIVERCLEKDPALRFQRVDELAKALVAFTAPTDVRLAGGVAVVEVDGGRPSLRATSIGVAVGTPPVVSPGTSSPNTTATASASTASPTITQSTTLRGSSRWMFVALAIAALGLGGFAAYRVTGSDRSTPMSSTAPSSLSTAPSSPSTAPSSPTTATPSTAPSTAPSSSTIATPSTAPSTTATPSTAPSTAPSSSTTAAPSTAPSSATTTAPSTASSTASSPSTRTPSATAPSTDSSTAPSTKPAKKKRPKKLEDDLIGPSF